MSNPVPLEEGKLLDFFRFFDPTRPQHVEGVRRLERSLRQLAPQLLTHQAFWVTGWRTQPMKPPVPDSINLKNLVKIQAQHFPDSCGQTSCAMAIQALTGKAMDDYTFRDRYGFSLLGGLRAECPKHAWWDQGNIGPDQWDDVAVSLNAGCYAIAAGNGPVFSPSGHGHIMLIMGITRETVIIADPNGGKLREIPKKTWEQAPQHPDGNFLFLSGPK